MEHIISLTRQSVLDWAPLGCVALGLPAVYLLVIKPWSSPLKHIPGPRANSFWRGALSLTLSLSVFKT